MVESLQSRQTHDAEGLVAQVDSRLVLIDLFSQREAVRKYLLGQPREVIVQWMREYGRVSEYYSEAENRPMYLFESVYGLDCPFFFEQGDELVIPDWGWVLTVR